MDLKLEVREDNENINLELYYSKELYEDELIKGILEQLKTIIDRICNNKDNKNNNSLLNISELPYSQKNHILNDFKGEKSDESDGETVVSMFRKQAKQYLDNGAVVYEEEKLTYRELEDIIDKLAAFLHKKGISKGKNVGILVKRGKMIPISTLSVLKSGAAYVPLDPGYPSERLQYMIQDALVSFVIADDDLTSVLPEYE